MKPIVVVMKLSSKWLCSVPIPQPSSVLQKFYQSNYKVRSRKWRACEREKMCEWERWSVLAAAKNFHEHFFQQEFRITMGGLKRIIECPCRWGTHRINPPFAEPAQRDEYWHENSHVNKVKEKHTFKNEKEWERRESMRIREKGKERKRALGP